MNWTLKQKYGFGLCLLLAWTLPVSASDTTLQDFAYGYQVNFDKGMSLYEFDVSSEIYESVVRPDLGDMRMFNVQGEVVSHRVYDLQQKNQVQDVQVSQELSIFPLYQSGGQNTQMGDIQIMTNDQGTIVNVGKHNAADNKNESKQNLLQGYLIDAATLEHPIEKIKIVTDQADEAQYYHTVSIEGSNDLKGWTSVERGAVLASLDHKGEQLIKDTISIGYGGYKYYRLIWEDKKTSLPIASITAHYSKSGKAEQPALSWVPVTGSISADSGSVFEYELPGYFPATAVEVMLTQPNSFGKVVLEARNAQDQIWSKQGEGTVFSVIKNGDTIEEKIIELSGKRFEFWRLVLQSEKEAFDSKPPMLKFGWMPETVRFLARGQSPFYIGFGSADVKPMVSNSLGDNNLATDIGHAQLSDYKVIGGIHKLTYHKPKESPWKSWVLWIILILGVGGLIYMAVKLAKDIQKDQTP